MADATPAVVVCPAGTYNEGWNSEPCRRCDAAGGSLTTDAPGAFSPDQCYTPPGHGTARTAEGGLTAAPCPADTFGVDDKTWGLVDAPCSECLEHTGTRGATGVTLGAACVTYPGYGYYTGAALECAFGTWAAGGDRSACTSCGLHYNTTDGQRAITGADGPDHCAAAAGWTPDGAGGLKPCPKGAYKDALGPAPCSPCPSGTTTTGTSAAAEVGKCDACRAGFGLPPGAARIDPAAPACALCTSGSFSKGAVTGGAACTPCPKPDGYLGVMVSRRVRPGRIIGGILNWAAPAACRRRASPRLASKHPGCCSCAALRSKSTLSARVGPSVASSPSKHPLRPPRPAPHLARAPSTPGAACQSLTATAPKTPACPTTASQWRTPPSRPRPGRAPSRPARPRARRAPVASECAACAFARVPVQPPGRRPARQTAPTRTVSHSPRKGFRCSRVPTQAHPTPQPPRYFEFRSDGAACRLRDFGPPLAGSVPNVDDPSRSYALFELRRGRARAPDPGERACHALVACAAGSHPAPAATRAHAKAAPAVSPQ
jgi:hypothetical protein